MGDLDQQDDVHNIEVSPKEMTSLLNMNMDWASAIEEPSAFLAEDPKVKMDDYKEGRILQDNLGPKE